jgi:hypothetical protein
MIKLTQEQTILEQLQFLRNALGTSEYRRVCRISFDALQELLWNEVLLKQEFTTLGAKRFRQDVLAIEEMAHVSFGSHTILMHKLMEGSELLSLPLHPKDGISLMEAADAVFGRKEDADEMLFDKLNFVRITRHEARTVMQQRREATT